MSYRAVMNQPHIGRFLLHDDLEDADEQACDSLKHEIPESAEGTKLHEKAERAFTHATDSQPYPGML